MGATQCSLAWAPRLWVECDPSNSNTARDLADGTVRARQVPADDTAHRPGRPVPAAGGAERRGRQAPDDGGRIRRGGQERAAVELGCGTITRRHILAVVRQR